MRRLTGIELALLAMCGVRIAPVNELEIWGEVARHAEKIFREQYQAERQLAELVDIGGEA